MARMHRQSDPVMPHNDSPYLMTDGGDGLPPIGGELPLQRQGDAMSLPRSVGTFIRSLQLHIGLP